MGDTGCYDFSAFESALPIVDDDSPPNYDLPPDQGPQWGDNSTPEYDFDGYPSYLLDNSGGNNDSYSESAPSTRVSSNSWANMGSSSSRATTIPRHVPGRRLFADQFSVPLRPRSNNPRLPCEFDRLADCPMDFHADEMSQWIEHVSDHLHFIFPWECVCWFCDDFTFDTSSTGGDPSSNFHTRMEHIRDHLVNGDYGLHQRRRDYFLLKHLNEHKLISSRVAKRELGTREGPKVPGESSKKQSSKNNRDDRPVGRAYDQAAEDRRRRKEQKDRGKSKKTW